MSRRAPKGLLIRLDPRGPGTLQQQIYAGLRKAIVDGVLAPGARLLSSRALAEDLGVSRTTSLLALEQLRAEGYLVARHGSGTYVADDLPLEAPRLPAVRAPAANHPPLSRRGAVLAGTPPAARRILGTPPRAFRIGTPAVDLFPVRTWAQLANRRLRAITVAQLDYGDAAGLRTLRAAIAEHVRTRGTQCSPDQVLVTAGAQRGLELAFRLLLDVGDAAWLEDPGFPGARSALLGVGARLVPVPVDAEGLDVAAGARLAGDARAAYVSPSHQFPLGVTMTMARRRALLRWASAARAWVVEDDYDSEFRYGVRPMPCLHGLDADGRVLYVGSFAKTLFPGLRLGFLIVPSDLQEQFRAARRAADTHPTVLDQAVLADFMAEGHFDRHLRRMQTAYRERLEALFAACQRHCRGAVRLRPTRAGLHVVADLEGVSAEAVFAEAMARGVEVMPLSAYRLGPGPGANALVLGFGAVRPDGLGRGMERLAAAIEAARAAVRR